GHEPSVAAVHAVRGAGHTILLSAASVLIGFAALMLVPLNELRAVAVGGALVVATSALTAVLPLPSLLAILGARVDRGRLLRRKRIVANYDGRWRHWANSVANRPLTVLALAGIPLIALAAQARRID